MDEALAPTTLDAVPAPQSVQTLALPKLYEPTWHWVCDVEPNVVLFLELDRHVLSNATQSGAHSAELLTVAHPGVEGRHCEELVLLEYDPIGHGVHVDFPAAL